jgi:VanZ family protein
LGLEKGPFYFMKISQQKAQYLAVSWLIIISILFALPGSALPKNDFLGDIQFDKWVHFGFFFILIWLWCKALYRGNKKIFLWLIFSAVIYGLSVEICQDQLVANRSFDIGDWIADTIGALAGIWFYRRSIKK